MMNKTVLLGILLALMVALAGCGDKSDGAAELSDGVRLSDDYADALPVPAQLAMGTIMLEGTNDAVTVEQAQELVPSWQMLRALQGSGTAAQAEIDAVLNQIQGAMTPEQLATIKEMQLTPTNLIEIAQERGFGRGIAGGAGGAGGFRPPAGVTPPGGGGRGGGFGPGGAFGAGNNLSPEEQEAAMAERMNAQMGTAMSGMLISLLEARAKGETLEMASAAQRIGNMRAVLGVVAEATGLDQREIVSQAREGKTLAEIIEANGADVDEILAQVVATETERVNQAVADGTLGQTDADGLLADLEARIKEMLEQPLEFGNRGVPGDSSGQP